VNRIASGKDFARFALGSLTVTALRDGHVDMPTSRLRQSGDRPFGADMPGEVTLVAGRLRLSVNAFLVAGQGGAVLIDAGAADAWEPSMGRLLQALAEAGVARDAIRTVAFTHTHIDHVGGLVAADGSDAFPKLDTVLIPEKEQRLLPITSDWPGSARAPCRLLTGSSSATASLPVRPRGTRWGIPRLRSPAAERCCWCGATSCTCHRSSSRGRS